MGSGFSKTLFKISGIISRPGKGGVSVGILEYGMKVDCLYLSVETKNVVRTIRYDRDPYCLSFDRMTGRGRPRSFHPRFDSISRTKKSDRQRP